MKKYITSKQVALALTDEKEKLILFNQCSHFFEAFLFANNIHSNMYKDLKQELYCQFDHILSKFDPQKSAFSTFIKFYFLNILNNNYYYIKEGYSIYSKQKYKLEIVGGDAAINNEYNFLIDFDYINKEDDDYKRDLLEKIYRKAGLKEKEIRTYQLFIGDGYTQSEIPTILFREGLTKKLLSRESIRQIYVQTKKKIEKIFTKSSI